MEERNEQPIDLNRLSQRELLIMTARDCKEMKGKIEDLEREVQDLKIQVTTVETRTDTKSRIYGGIVGFFTGLVPTVIERLTR